MADESGLTSAVLRRCPMECCSFARSGFFPLSPPCSDGWRFASQAEVPVKDVTHPLSLYVESLGDLGQGQSLNQAQPEHFLLALVGSSLSAGRE